MDLLWRDISVVNTGWVLGDWNNLWISCDEMWICSAWWVVAVVGYWLIDMRLCI